VGGWREGKGGRGVGVLVALVGFDVPPAVRRGSSEGVSE
jgi:hypothetical protein